MFDRQRRNPNKKRQNVNEPAQNLNGKKTSETLFIQKNRSVFWPGNFLEDW